jgi:hypothetical protein
MLYGFYQDDGDALYEFIDDILDSTATLRIMMYEKGAFVGWLPLAFKSRVDLAPHHQSEYTEQWREMPLENAFYCPEWTEEVLYYSPGEVEVPVAGSVEAKHVGYINVSQSVCQVSNSSTGTLRLPRGRKRVSGTERGW